MSSQYIINLLPLVDTLNVFRSCDRQYLMVFGFGDNHGIGKM